MCKNIIRLILISYLPQSSQILTARGLPLQPSGVLNPLTHNKALRDEVVHGVHPVEQTETWSGTVTVGEILLA